LLGTFITSAILRASQATIEQITSAIFFIPAITAMSGNVGLQSSTTIIRGLAIGQVNFSMIFRVVSKEVRAAMIIGALCGILVTLYALILGIGENVGLIVGLAMCISISFSAIVGTIIPLSCDKLGIDPAIAAGPFITTLDDSLSIAIYMAIIAVFLT
jgi:magnesium transporter